jgi:hypothetical protein
LAERERVSIKQGSRIIGIDPGTKGAIAYVERDARRSITDVRVVDIITFRHGSQNLVDVEAMLEETTMWPVADFAVFEKPLLVRTPGEKEVFALPANLRKEKGIQTATATLWTSLPNYGRLQCIIERRAHEWHEVEPGAWKRALGLSADKSLSVDEAKRIYPAHVHHIRRRKKWDDNRAEAMLLAYYGLWHIWIPKLAERQETLARTALAHGAEMRTM